jgi:outer membrane protein assembly factor BamA
MRAGVHETYRNVGVTSPLWGKNAQEDLRGFGIPGLLTGGTILSTVIALDHDRLEQTDLISRNNAEHIEVSFNRSAGNGDFGYWKYRLEAQHFFPLKADHRTAIALRAFAETDQRTHGEVPFFDMPMLGTWETLRGFENFRFRDRSALSVTVEYRYRIWRLMDWAFFLDEGQVAPRPRDFGWNRFHAGYGFRWFIYLKPRFPVVIDFASSAEKTHLLFERREPYVKGALYINFGTTF